MLEIAEKDQHANLYPSGACEWEMKQGIVRVEIDGMLYIQAPDWDAANASMDREQAERTRKIAADRMARSYADRAAEYYGGGT